MSHEKQALTWKHFKILFFEGGYKKQKRKEQKLAGPKR